MLTSGYNMEPFLKTNTDDKCYTCNFEGEGSQDYGGPFRESLTNFAAEFE